MNEWINIISFIHSWVRFQISSLLVQLQQYHSELALLSTSFILIKQAGFEANTAKMNSRQAICWKRISLSSALKAMLLAWLVRFSSKPVPSVALNGRLNRTYVADKPTAGISGIWRSRFQKFLLCGKLTPEILAFGKPIPEFPTFLHWLRPFRPFRISDIRVGMSVSGLFSASRGGKATLLPWL